MEMFLRKGNFFFLQNINITELKIWSTKLIYLMVEGKGKRRDGKNTSDTGCGKWTLR